METPAPYAVYMLLCADGSLYTGIARDVAKRLQEHNESEKGAKYTKGRRPVSLVYQEPAADRSEAQKREHALRQLTPAQKRSLIQNFATKMD